MKSVRVNRKQGFSWWRVIAALAILLSPFFVLVFSALFLPRRIGLVLEEILFGWWHFAERTAPRIALNWDLFGMAVICIGGVLALSHLLFRHVRRVRPSGSGGNQNWRLRWTVAINCLCWLGFFVATAVAGLAEQIQWLRSIEGESFLVVRRWGTQARHAVKYVSMEILIQTHDGVPARKAIDEAAKSLRDDFVGPTARYRDFRVFGLLNETNGYAGVLIFRRVGIEHPDQSVVEFDPELGEFEHPRGEIGKLLSQPGRQAVPIF